MLLTATPDADGGGNMGREALTVARIGAETASVKALLESGELILRGEIKRRYPRDSIALPGVVGDTLQFKVGDEDVALELGALEASKWLKALLTPAPSLKDKLGLAKGGEAMLVRPIDDTALCAALLDATCNDLAHASMLIAPVEGLADLESALELHARAPHLPIWVIYPKGAAATFGDAAIRSMLRERGFRDSKSCAVSDRLTATRYGLPR